MGPGEGVILSKDMPVVDIEFCWITITSLDAVDSEI